MQILLIPPNEYIFLVARMMLCKHRFLNQTYVHLLTKGLLCIYLLQMSHQH
jgi:hypothetical protein